MNEKPERRCHYHPSVTMLLEAGIMRHRAVTPVHVKMRRTFYRCAVDGCPYVECGETKMTSDDRFKSMEMTA